MSQWNENFQKAIMCWTSRKDISSEIFSLEDEEVVLLIEIEKEYDELVSKLAAELEGESELLLLLKSDNIDASQVATQIVLLSQNSFLESALVDLMEIRENAIHRRIKPVLSVCAPEIVTAFCHKALLNQKPWILEALASHIGKNQLGQLMGYYFKDGQLLTNHHSVLEMLGYLGAFEYGTMLKHEMNLVENGSFIQQVCADSLLMLGDEQGLTFYRQLLAGNQPDGTLAFRLGRFASTADIQFLQQVASRTTDVQVLSHLIIGIGFAGDYSSIPFLEGLLEHQEPGIVAAASNAISEIVGEWDIESEADEVHAFWTGWLPEHNSEFEAGIRYKDGNAFDLVDLTFELMDADEETRALRHSALIIYSGLHLPFDELRYLSDQVQQSKSWRSAIQAMSLPSGKWIRFGKSVE